MIFFLLHPFVFVFFSRRHFFRYINSTMAILNKIKKRGTNNVKKELRRCSNVLFISFVQFFSALVEHKMNNKSVNFGKANFYLGALRSFFLICALVDGEERVITFHIFSSFIFWLGLCVIPLSVCSCERRLLAIVVWKTRVSARFLYF